MMGEVEPQQAGSLADVMTLHQQTFRLVYYIIMYVTDGCTTCGFMNQISKITWRIGQFGGAPRDSGQALRQLAVLAEIGLQQVMKTFQQVVLSPIFFRQLAQIDTWVSNCVMKSHSSGSIRSEPSKKYEKN